MAPTGDVVDFYIDLVKFFTTEQESWYICDGAGLHSRCMAVLDELDEAIEHAVKMADYQVARGSTARIHVKQEDGSWKTIWWSSDDKARST